MRLMSTLISLVLLSVTLVAQEPPTVPPGTRGGQAQTAAVRDVRTDHRVTLGASRTAAKNEHVKSISAITEVFGDGQRITAAAVEYDKDIVNSQLTNASFSVSGRTVTRVYANNTAAKAPEGLNGRFAIIELSPAEKAAVIFESNPPGMGGRGRGRGAPTEPSKGPPPAPPILDRKPARVSVTQLAVITTTDGQKYAPVAGAMENDKLVNLIVDDFLQLEFKDSQTGETLKYNLFVPKNYDKNRSYPLVMFIHDASVISSETDTTLIQGLGAVIWASPSEQAKHPCFVLAPQFATSGTGSSERWETTVNLIHHVASRYSVDKNRIYTTGQSLGCMLSIAIAIKYPDLFAAMFLVAGQWDAQAMAVLAHKNIWIIVSEGDARAFPGMNASLEVMEAAGAKISRAKWSARAGEAETAAAVKRMIQEGNNIKYVVYEKGTTIPEDISPAGVNEHMQTWKVAYTVEGVRDWLFTQKK